MPPGTSYLNQLDQNGPDEADLARLEEFRNFVEPLGGRINVDKLESTATKDRECDYRCQL